MEKPLPALQEGDKAEVVNMMKDKTEEDRAEDRDEEEYHFPEDLLEYLMFSQLGPALVVLTLVLFSLVTSRISRAFFRRGASKDQ